MRALLLLSAALLAACGTVYGQAGVGGASGTGSGTPGSADASPTPLVSAKVTTADDHKTVTAHVGDHVQIALGEQQHWTLDPPDGVVLTRPAVQNYMLVRGTQAIWLASAPGTSTIRATGTAVCPSGVACPQYAILFTATVNVVP